MRKRTSGDLTKGRFLPTDQLDQAGNERYQFQPSLFARSALPPAPIPVAPQLGPDEPVDKSFEPPTVRSLEVDREAAWARHVWRTEQDQEVAPALPRMSAGWLKRFTDALASGSSITPIASTRPNPETGEISGRHVLCDCCAFTIPPSTEGEVPTAQWVVEHVLGVPFQLFDKVDRGWQGYRHGLQWGWIRVWYGGRPEMGVHVSVQGKACRQLEDVYGENTWEPLLARICAYGGWLSRIDLAVDDVAIDQDHAYLDYGTMVRYTLPVRGRWVDDGMGGLRKCTRVRSPLRGLRVYRERVLSTGEREGDGIYLGSGGSPFMVRIYDKALEKGYQYHHIRVEMQIRRGDGHSKEALRHILEQGLEKASLGILRRHVQFVDPSRDSNSRRWPIAPWWRRFTEEGPDLRLWTEGSTPDLEKKLEWLQQVGGPTLAMAFEALGDNWTALWDWLVKAVEGGRDRLTKRHKAVLDAWRVRSQAWVDDVHGVLATAYRMSCGVQLPLAPQLVPLFVGNPDRRIPYPSEPINLAI